MVFIQSFVLDRLYDSNLKLVTNIEIINDTIVVDRLSLKIIKRLKYKVLHINLIPYSKTSTLQ